MGEGTLNSMTDPLKKQGRAPNLEKGDNKWLLGNTEVKLKRICNVDVRQKATRAVQRNLDVSSHIVSNSDVTKRGST